MTTSSVNPAVRRVEVSTSGASYPVLVGAGAADAVPDIVAGATSGRRVAVVSDSNVASLHADSIVEALVAGGMVATLHTFPAGEAFKVRKSWATLTDELLDAGVGRDACVVTVGGGVTTDLGGFVAATYMRGLPVVHVPTSSLAMIDAAVGGKTGVDTRAGKNLVGAFHAPRAVIADTDLLSTLPKAFYAEGLVEALKHGAIRSDAHFEAVRDGARGLLDGDGRGAASIVHDSVRIKADVVAADEFESGLREILNFGHTLGHAIESASDFAVGHGAAVAIGMVLEARLGERIGVTAEGTARRLTEALEPLDLPPADGLDLERVLAYLLTDKKVRGGRPRFVLLERIGAAAVDGGTAHDVPDEVVRTVLVEALN